MAKQLEVILLEDVDGIGRAGQIVKVAEGHARNMLFPDGKAALATPQLKTRAEHQAKKDERAALTKLTALQELAEKLDGSELLFQARVHDKKDIYGSIGRTDIAQRLNREAKLAVKPKDIELQDPIKQLGSTDVLVRLSPQVECKIRVTIVPIVDLHANEEE